MPVMEGKSLLFKEFGDVDSYPICVDSKDPAEIIAICEAIGAPIPSQCDGLPLTPFLHDEEPLGLQWYRRVRQLFLSKFDV